MNYEVVVTSCDCHPETCGHWRYVVCTPDGYAVRGFDTKHDLNEFLAEQNKGNN